MMLSNGAAAGVGSQGSVIVLDYIVAVVRSIKGNIPAATPWRQRRHASCL